MASMWKEFRKLKNMEIGLNRRMNRIKFLKTCINLDIVPKSLRIKGPLHFLKEAQNILSKASTKITEALIRQLKYETMLLRKDIEIEKERLQLTIMQSIYEKMLERIAICVDNMNRNHDLSINRKLEFLITESDYPEVRKHVRRANKKILNLSNTTVTSETESLLAKGPTFNVDIGSKNEEDKIAEFQNILDQIPRELSFKVGYEISKFLQQKEQKSTANMKNSYFRAKKELKEKGLLAVRSDKSNEMVIISENDYNLKMQTIINELFEQEIIDNTEEVIDKIKKAASLFNIKKIIEPSHFVPELFGFIKTHKQNYPIRPVVTTKGGPLHKLEKFLFEILKEEIPKSRFAFQDSMEVVKKIKSCGINESSRFLSLDIENMFPSIPLNILFTEINRKFEEKDQSVFMTSHGIQPNDLTFLLNLFCSSVVSRYKENIYRQKRGLSIGSSISPILADFFISMLETCLLKSKKLSLQLYGRYVDDILIIYDSRIHTPQEILNEFNQMNNNITFKMELEQNKQLQYLDIRLIREKDKIEYIHSFKKEKSDIMLNYQSFHTKTVKINTAKSMLLRAKTLSSKKYQKEAITNMAKTLINNEYPKKLILRKLKEIKEEKPKSTNQSKNNKKINYIPINNYGNINYRINKQLKDSKFRISTTATNKITKMANKSTKNKDEPMERKNIVYSIPFSCSQQYVGQTARILKTRIIEHQKATEKGDQNSAILKHLQECNCQPLWDQTKVLNYEQNWNKRLIKESYYIKKYHPINEPTKIINSVFNMCFQNTA